MYYPTLSDRVRVSGHEDKFIIVRVDHIAFVVDLRPMMGQSPLEQDVPFHMLQFDDTSFEDRLADVRAVLKSSHVSIRQSHAAVAELMELIVATTDAIQSSQRLIADSDRIIARKGSLHRYRD